MGGLFRDLRHHNVWLARFSKGRVRPPRVGSPPHYSVAGSSFEARVNRHPLRLFRSWRPPLRRPVVSTEGIRSPALCLPRQPHRESSSTRRTRRRMSRPSAPWSKTSMTTSFRPLLPNKPRSVPRKPNCESYRLPTDGADNQLPLIVSVQTVYLRRHVAAAAARRCIPIASTAADGCSLIRAPNPSASTRAGALWMPRETRRRAESSRRTKGVI